MKLSNSQISLNALGRLKKGQLNKTEQAYQDHLEQLKSAGLIAWYKFEGVTLRIAEGASFTPDFLVMLPDGQLEFREVKGFWREAAKVRMKVAASLFPFKFMAVKQRAKKNGGGWDIEVFE